MILQKLHASRSSFLQSYNNGVLLNRTGKPSNWNLAFYKDLAPTVPYYIESRHTIEGRQIKPRLLKSEAKRLLSFLKEALGR